jgi:hypothetical protein
MEKKLIVRFMKEKKKGCYRLLAELYVDQISSLPIVMALEIIREDLQRESNEPIQLNYFSLARAIARFKKKNPAVVKGKFQFKDAHELDKAQSSPGKFKLG